MQYERDGDGNVLNAPVDPDFERRLVQAQNRADVRAIQRITDEYAEWREQRIADDESDDDTPDRTDGFIDATPGAGANVPGASTPNTQTLGGEAPAFADPDAGPTPTEDVPQRDTAAPADPDSAADVRSSSEQGV